MITRGDSVWARLDWVTVIFFLLLIVAGWFSICGASFEFGDKLNFFDYATRSGKQFIWIICSFVICFVLLMLDRSFFEAVSHIAYIGMLLLLFMTIFIAPDVKGSHSWLVLGPVSLQPAEFAKFTTALMLAKYIDSSSFNMKKLSCKFIAMAIFIVPMLFIIMQRETGSALVYLAFFLVLYREGMSGSILFTGFCTIVYFIVGIRFGGVMMPDGASQLGEFIVLLLINIVTGGMVYIYTERHEEARNIILIPLSVTIISYIVSIYLFPFNVVYVEVVLCILIIGYLLFLWISSRQRIYLWVACFSLFSICFLFSSNYVFNNVLEPHQQVRIKIVLGLEQDLTGAGYNVNQSKIAIGSGGLIGKGFLKGTQTKLKYVPEQDTDFIFCTIGEEQGFLGSSIVILVYLLLIFRLIFLAERQTRTFGRVYGYSVVSIFLFHLFINIGMVLGITPVIGIPLPFFSYGGSSLWGFAILLFIFLRTDAGR